MRRFLVLFALAIGAIVVPADAKADVTYGASTSVFMSSSMYSDVFGQQDLNIRTLQGNAAPPFSTSYGPETIFQTNNIFTVGAEIASGFVSSDVDGTLGPKEAEGDLAVSFFSFEVLDILSITSETLESNTLINGDIGSINRSGFINLGADLVVTVLGSGVNTTNPGEIYNQDGLRITMGHFGFIDEPFASGISATAFLIQFDGFIHDGDVLTGTVTLGQTSAYMQAVPEPASMLVLGGLGLAVAFRRRRK